MFNKFITLFLCLFIVYSIHGKEKNIVTIKIINDTIICNKDNSHQETLNKIAGTIVLNLLRKEVARLKIGFSKQKSQQIIKSYLAKNNFEKAINQYAKTYKKECIFIYNCLRKMDKEGLTSSQTYDKYLKNNSLKVPSQKWQSYCNTYLSKGGIKRLKKIVNTPVADIKQEMLMNSVIIPQYWYVLSQKVAKINQPSDADVTTYLSKHTLPAEIDKLPIENQRDFCKIMLHKAMIGKWWKERFRYYRIETSSPYDKAINLALERCIRLSWSHKLFEKLLKSKNASNKQTNNSTSKSSKQTKIVNWTNNSSSKKNSNMIESKSKSAAEKFSIIRSKIISNKKSNNNSTSKSSNQ